MQWMQIETAVSNHIDDILSQLFGMVESWVECVEVITLHDEVQRAFELELTQQSLELVELFKYDNLYILV